MSYNYPNQSPPPSSARGDEVTPIDAWKADLVTKDNDASTGNLNKRPSTGSDGENPHNKHRSGSNYKSADAFERLETTGQPTPNKYMPSSTNNHLSSSSQPPSRQLIEERIEEGTASVSPSSQHLGPSSSFATNSTIIRQPIVEQSTQVQEDIIERASRLESDLHLLSQLRNYIIEIGKDKNSSAGHPHQFPLLSNLDKCVWCHADELTHTGGRKLLFPHELLFKVSALSRLTPNESEVDKNHLVGILSRWEYPADKIKNQLRQQKGMRKKWKEWGYIKGPKTSDNNVIECISMLFFVNLVEHHILEHYAYDGVEPHKNQRPKPSQNIHNTDGALVELPTVGVNDIPVQHLVLAVIDVQADAANAESDGDNPESPIFTGDEPASNFHYRRDDDQNDGPGGSCGKGSAPPSNKFSSSSGSLNSSQNSFRRNLNHRSTSSGSRRPLQSTSFVVGEDYDDTSSYVDDPEESDYDDYDGDSDCGDSGGNLVVKKTLMPNFEKDDETSVISNHRIDDQQNVDQLSREFNELSLDCTVDTILSQMHYSASQASFGSIDANQGQMHYSASQASFGSPASHPVEFGVFPEDDNDCGLDLNSECNNRSSETSKEGAESDSSFEQEDDLALNAIDTVADTVVHLFECKQDFDFDSSQDSSLECSSNHGDGTYSLLEEQYTAADRFITPLSPPKTGASRESLSTNGNSLHRSTSHTRRSSYCDENLQVKKNQCLEYVEDDFCTI